MHVWKRNLVAVAVLVTVCAGIYVNWLYTEDKAVSNLEETLNADKIMASDTLVMSDGSILPSDTEEVVSSDYFAAVRLSRQQARDSAVGLLQEAMAYDKAEENSQANAKLETIVQTALDEAQIESLVVAKGYADCVAYISDEGISIAVAAPEGGLAQKDVAVIADIVMTQSQYGMEDIRVVEVQ
jgi:stage III sporulation protein AH